MTIKTAHLIFKTHLDIGFTDYAANVVQTYFEYFIPRSLELARQTRELPQRFRWTTGAWLIYEYLEQAPPAQRQVMEHAIEAGDIQWHALPFTTHTELMDASLFRFGLSYAQRLDKRFGRNTIAAKMTDVPGHTRAMIPLLAEAGVKFLHLGVNQASTLPDVPPAFVWHDKTSGTDLIVIYEGDYGGITVIPGLEDALAITLTADNVGPPSTDAIRATYATVAQRLPQAQLIASTLDDYTKKILEVQQHLPIITAEIGDTWIHGAGTDPLKTARYRALARLRQGWQQRQLSADEQQHVARFSHHLIMVPEHTWGMDEKTHLADRNHYTSQELTALRQTERCQKFEASWQEQRAYIDQALAALKGTTLAAEANNDLAHVTPTKPDTSTMTQAHVLSLSNDKLRVKFDAQTGAINDLYDHRTDTQWADTNHPLALFSYTAYSIEDYNRFWGQYIRNKQDTSVVWWSIEDYTKPGMTSRPRIDSQPQVIAAHQANADTLIFTLSFPLDAQIFGVPQQATLTYQLHDTSLAITLAWFDKAPSRMPEAFWLTFRPRTTAEGIWHLQKMGQWINPADVISKGARTLHAVDQDIRYTTPTQILTITTLDAPLVAPGQPALLDFHNNLPATSDGIHVNLYNNKWGTNFPMWYTDDTQWRFSLTLNT